MTSTQIPYNPVRSTSSVPPAISLLRGAQAHRQGVERLLASYRAIPAGATVRLAKRTSNLFRPRTQTTVAGLDVSGLDGVISIDHRGQVIEFKKRETLEIVDAGNGLGVESNHHIALGHAGVLSRTIRLDSGHENGGVGN